ncbi:hypothetical protein RND81_11G142100 [Saponaria officinalis]|uniref:Polyprotein n=1 Tax=Saponaria officinalis TaxID=3572 RepID=A0AAW1HLW7_SAPOF
MYDDPLYISASDQPSLQVVSRSFNGDNFVHRKRDVYLALMAKNKEGFLDGELVERYGQTNNVEIYQIIKKDLSTITQENASLIKYYSRLKRIWESLDSLDPVPLCICGALDQCTCQLLKKMVDRESNAKLIQFLMGLNSGYEVAKTNVLSIDPLPTMNKALSLLHKIERQKQIDDAVDVLIEANAYATAQQTDQRPPSWKKHKVETMTADKSHLECSYCHHIGHTGNEIYAPVHSAKTATHVPAVDDHDDVVAVSPLNSVLDSTVFEGIIKTVTQNVLKAFTEQPVATSSNFATANFTGTIQTSPLFPTSNSVTMCTWIVDTGVSDHMTSRLDILRDVVVLPKPHKVGTITMNSAITLHRVLLVPDFRQNLLSVGKLIDDNHFVALFNPIECVCFKTFQVRLLWAQLGDMEIFIGLAIVRIMIVNL